MKNHNERLGDNLSEWKNRMRESDFRTFANQWQYFMENINKTTVLASMINEICIKYPAKRYDFEAGAEGRGRNLQYSGFESEAENAAYSYQLLRFLVHKYGNYSNIINETTILGVGLENVKTRVINDHITPIVNYLQDQLKVSNFTIFLLGKYKLRTEWFTKTELLKSYYGVTNKEYEGIFENDLRLFLFDQGIDYPFSTPKLIQGRADIVGLIDTGDPLIIEVKIIDKDKKYGLERIKSGFTQIAKYTEEFNKDFGYLVIYNINKEEINFKFDDSDKTFPPRLTFKDKTFFFIVINLYSDQAPSKQGQSKALNITSNDLISSW